MAENVCWDSPRRFAGHARSFSRRMSTGTPDTCKRQAQPSEMQLVPGGLVRLHGLKLKPELNNQPALLVEYVEEKRRWKTRTRDGVERYVSPHNMALMAEVGASQVSNTCTAAGNVSHQPANTLMDARPIPAETENTTPAMESQQQLAMIQQLGCVEWARPGAVALLERQLKEWEEFMCNTASANKLASTLDAVTNHLESEKQTALHSIERASTAAQQKIEQLRDEALMLSQASATAITAYAELPAPRTYQQRCERNRCRHELQLTAQDIQQALKNIFEAIALPFETLNNVQGPMLQQLSESINHIQRLKDATTGLLIKCDEKVLCDRRAAQQTLAELWPHIEPMNKFVHQLNSELCSEIEENRAMHQKQFEDLQQKEVRFVRVNESPERNEEFANVRKQLAKEQAKLEELERQSRDAVEAHKSWEVLIGSMPRGDVTVHQLNSELCSEIEENRAMHQRQFSDLQQKEEQFVRVNESPEGNEEFANVQEQLAKEEARLEELERQSFDAVEAHKSWEALIGSMPRGDVADVLAMPGMRGGSGNIGGFGRRAALQPHQRLLTSLL
eukprot:CAMPEP_0172937868 /NCGR_PEP_ID=MMETSP1075-20121228/222735_1 /TAXON_ID=2916 /ORGANISM="Ceratium fusus, Strain PA161109" /LENGTH=562 /DNA_ID=CAMNT_0013799243 /DNA_START=88 /DNA_END=1777 /DNA_ORIENTATION=+